MQTQVVLSKNDMGARVDFLKITDDGKDMFFWHNPQDGDVGPFETLADAMEHWANAQHWRSLERKQAGETIKDNVIYVDFKNKCVMR